MGSFEKILYWLIEGTRGGKNRFKIIKELDESPMNANEISEELELDYKTVRHHLDTMEEHGVLTAAGDKYGKNYFLSDKMEENKDKLEDLSFDMGDEA